MVNKTEGLLDMLGRRCGCAYLSDLPTLAARDKLHEVLSELDANGWPLKEWQEAAAYLTRQNCTLADAGEIRSLLLVYTGEHV